MDNNIELIDQVIQVYEDNKTLTLLEGMRPTLPLALFPSLEVEATSVSNSWWTTRSQRPRFSFQLTLTISCDLLEYSQEYACALGTRIAEILTDPTNLQAPVENEQKWDPNEGLVQTYILDSLVENMTINANQDGTIRVVEMDWFAMIHEPFPQSKWELGRESEYPTIIRPMEIE